MTKIESDAMLVLLNVTIELSNVKKKQNKIMVPQIVTKLWLDVMLVLPNVTMKFSNVREK